MYFTSFRKINTRIAGATGNALPSLTTLNNTNYGNAWANASFTTSNTVCLNSNISGLGQYMVVPNYNVGIYVSSNYGTSFTKISSVLDTYSDSTISWSGKYICVYTFAGNTYISSNYGVSFGKVTGLLTYNFSLNETYQYKITSTNQLQLSSNSGTSFTSTGLGSILSASMSQTGQFIVANTSTTLYYSSNYGSSFSTVRTGTGFVSCKISLDGINILLNAGTTLHSSINSGSTWRTYTLASMNFIGASYTCKYVYCNVSSNIYVSSNYGQTFAQVASIANLWNVSISYDGKYALATTQTNGNVIISNNYGNSWNTKTTGISMSTPLTSQYLFSSLSGDGKYMLLTSNFTSNNIVYKSLNST